MEYYSNFIISSDKISSGPCLLTINAKELENEDDIDENRTAIDLVCIIDKSGSMRGKKIKLVHETLEFIIEQLNENDRISIISFDGEAAREVGLVKITDDKKLALVKIINQINADRGSTNIVRGMEITLKILKERK